MATDTKTLPQEKPILLSPLQLERLRATLASLRAANPDHLFVGTARDNAHDAMKKNRFKTVVRKLKPRPTGRPNKGGR